MGKARSHLKNGPEGFPWRGEALPRPPAPPDGTLRGNEPPAIGLEVATPWKGQVYELADGVRLLEDANGYCLLRDVPLSLLRINAGAFELLRRCDGRATLAEAAEGMDAAEARQLLHHLCRLGFARQVALQTRPGLATAASLPSVSVVVPVRNRPRQIKECVSSLLALDYPSDKLEIIVVDDASEDETPAVLAELPIESVLRSTPSGAASCRNAGWQVARGELVAFTDSDCRADPDWLKELVDRLTEQDAAAVGGLVKSPKSASRIDRYEATRSPLYSGRTEQEITNESAISYLPTCNLVVRKSVLEQLSGFDLSFPLAVGEDVDLVWRIVDAGHRVLYAPRGSVTHDHRKSLAQFAVRRSEYAASEAQLLKKHLHRRRTLTLSVPALLSLAVLCAAPATDWRFAVGALALVVALHAALMRRKLGAAFPQVGWPGVILAVLRGYLGFAQYLLLTIAQYYTLPLLFFLALAAGYSVLPLLPSLGVVVLLLALAAALSYLADRPALSVPGFMSLFYLDKLSNQVGVILGCIKYRTLRPFLPRLKIVF